MYYKINNHYHLVDAVLLSSGYTHNIISTM